MKRILYVITSLSHKRCFESFQERDDCVQMVVGPKPSITQDIVPEDYSDFKIKDIRYYNGQKGLQKIVTNFNPNVYVQASLPCAHNITLPKGCKKVYVSHGMIGNHVVSIIKSAGFNTSVWGGCDLYCGASEVFRQWIKRVTKFGDERIMLNAIPQFDIIHNPEYYNKYRGRLLNQSKKPSAKKIILFAGFCCRDRVDFNNHNADYFKTAIELERLARKNNWLIMIKPRQTFKVMMQFLKSHAWGRQFIKPYTDIQNSNHVHFITTTGHIYRYFFADAFVINGTSTIEVEACAIKKPLFVIRTSPKNNSDPFNIVLNNAGKFIDNISDIGPSLKSHFSNGAHHFPNNQEKIIRDFGILFDGKMHQRVQDKLLTL